MMGFLTKSMKWQKNSLIEIFISFQHLAQFESEERHDDQLGMASFQPSNYVKGAF